MRTKGFMPLATDEVRYLLDPVTYASFYYYNDTRTRYLREGVARSSFMQRLLPLIDNRMHRLANRYSIPLSVARHLAIMELTGFHLEKDWYAKPQFADVRLPRAYIENHPDLDIHHFVCVDDSADLWAHHYVAFYCEHCEAGELHVNAVRVNVSLSRTENWCEFCVNDDTFTCEISDRVYSYNHFSPGETVNGYTICEEYAAANGWVQNDDGQWTDDPDDRCYGDSGIPEYHNARRPSFVAPEVFISHEQRTYGIELEVHFPSFDDREQFFQENFKPSGLSNCGNFCAELDGSLDDECGLEVISRPFALAEYYADDAPWARMCKMLYDYGAVGWPMRDTYGMHVNVDVRSLGMTKSDAFHNDALLRQRMAAVNAMLVNNRELTAKLAGRYLPYETSVPTVYHQGAMKAQKLQNLHDSATQLDSRYVFATRKNKTVMEVRIFGSNVRFAGIRRNIEYVDSLLAYTQLSNTRLFGDMTFSAYWRWLRRPENCYRWPYLAAYLDPKVTNENRDVKRAVR